MVPSPSQYSWNPANYRTWDVASEFFAYMRSKGLSELTIKNYRECLSRFSELFPHLGDAINKEAISTFLGTFPVGKEHEQTKFLKFSNIRAFYYWMADYKGYEPARLKFRLLTPKVSRRVRSHLSNEQALKLMQLLQKMSDRDRALIDLIMEAGPRVGEITTLLKENIQDRYITIEGKEGERMIQISPELRDRLRKLNPESSGPVFINHNTGEAYCMETLRHIVRNWLTQSGITTGKLGPHRLRHTFGRLYLRDGGTLEGLRQMLGHTDIKTTALYAELDQEDVHTEHEKANPRANLMKQLTLDGVLEGNHGE